jgi:hypothetical protein
MADGTATQTSKGPIFWAETAGAVGPESSAAAVDRAMDFVLPPGRRYGVHGGLSRSERPSSALTDFGRLARWNFLGNLLLTDLDELALLGFDQSLDLEECVAQGRALRSSPQVVDPTASFCPQGDAVRDKSQGGNSE